MIAQREYVQVATPAAIDPACTSSSYTIGPLHPNQIRLQKEDVSTGQEITLLLPLLLLPPSVLTDQAFKAGYETGYLACDLAGLTVPQLVNELFYLLDYAALDAECEDADPCSWFVGELLGELAYLAESAKLLARTGLAHLCFLLSFFSRDPLSWPSHRMRQEMGSLHNTAVKAYRADFRAYRMQGKSYREAQRLTLLASKHRTEVDLSW